MIGTRKALLWTTVATGTALLLGCQAAQRARVGFDYVVEPDEPLPPGIKTVAVAPARVGPNTDARWSDLCATELLSLVNESRRRGGADIRISDRRDTQATFDEADLEASGMSTRRGSDHSSGDGGRILAADGVILSNINVKIDRRVGRQPTISGLSLGGGGGHGFRAGRFDIETREVETVARTLTVQSEFKLVDTSDNHIVAHYSPDPYSATDRTRTSLLFGTSRSEAELAPSDRIILSLVRRAAREFVCGILPCNISVSTVVEASPDEDCLRAVKMLRAEAFEDALRHFRRALYHHPDDHRAAYGAGVTCEALGLYDRALRYYRRACAAKDSDKYITARDRMKRYAHRARP